MRVLLAGMVVGLSLSAGHAGPVAIEQGAHATIAVAEDSAAILVEETSWPAHGASGRSGTLDITMSGFSETHECVYAMSRDPVLFGSANLDAACGPYDVAASFTVIGGGSGSIPILCRADFSRPSETTVTISSADVVVLEATTTNSRVWTNVDLGTCVP